MNFDLNVNNHDPSDFRIWKDMSLNDSMDAVERAKLAVWDYPVSDKFTNMWSAMEEAGFPKTFQGAIERMKNPPEGEEYAFIGGKFILYIYIPNEE